MSRPAISKHLRILKEAGLVAETPAGRQRIYGLESAPLKSVEGGGSKDSTARRGSNGGGKRGDLDRPTSRRYRDVASDPMTDWRVW